MTNEHTPGRERSPSLLTTEYLWFFNTLVRVQVSCTSGSDDLSLLEHRAPYGDSPPLHRHRNEDEVFYILEGEFRFRVGEREQRAGPGTALLVPRGVPHTYRVESRDGARWLTVTRARDFERFVRTLGRPAPRPELPPPGPAPTAAAIAELTAIAAAHAIDLCGPPLG